MIKCKKCQKEFDAGLTKCPHCNEDVIAITKGLVIPAPEVNQTEKDEPIKKFVKIDKTDDDKQLVYGVVYEPNVVDAQNDYAEPDEIEKACHNYMENYQNVSWMHKELINEDAKIVECYIAQADFNLGERPVKKGAWILVVHVINKDIWSDIKKGNITGYSLEGSAQSKSLVKGIDGKTEPATKEKPRKLINLCVTAVALVDSPANRLSFNLVKRDVSDMFNIADLAGMIGSMKSMLNWIKENGKIDDKIVKELINEIAKISGEILVKGGVDFKFPEKPDVSKMEVVIKLSDTEEIKTTIEDIKTVIAKKSAELKDEIAKKDTIIATYEAMIKEMHGVMTEMGKKIPTAESLKKMLEDFAKRGAKELDKLFKSQN